MTVRLFRQCPSVEVWFQCRNPWWLINVSLLTVDNDKRISFEPQEEEMKPNAEIVKHENFVACNESNEDEGVSGREAILCSILTIAINAYPAGATTNDLVNYCDSNKFRVKRTLIENTLYKYPNLFCRIKSEDDVERWSFNGFHTFKDYGQSH